MLEEGRWAFGGRRGGRKRNEVWVLLAKSEPLLVGLQGEEERSSSVPSRRKRTRKR